MARVLLVGNAAAHPQGIEGQSTVQCFEDETQNLALDALSDGQPVQSTQGRDDMIILLHPAHHPSCKVLHELQPVKELSR